MTTRYVQQSPDVPSDVESSFLTLYAFVISNAMTSLCVRLLSENICLCLWMFLKYLSNSRIVSWEMCGKYFVLQWERCIKLRKLWYLIDSFRNRFNGSWNWQDNFRPPDRFIAGIVDSGWNRTCKQLKAFFLGSWLLWGFLTAIQMHETFCWNIVQADQVLFLS